MPDPASDPEICRLLTRLIQLAQAIRVFVGQLSQERFPSEVPGDLAAITASLATKSVTSLMDELRQLESYRVRGYKFRLRLTHRLLERFVSHLRFVERARIDQVPYGLARTLDTLARELYEDAAFLIRPQWHCNFSEKELVSTYKEWARSRFANVLSPNDIDRLFVGRDGIAISTLYVLGFPRIEKHSILSYVLLGHELGHPLADHYLANRVDDREVEKVIMRTPSFGDLSSTRDEPPHQGAAEESAEAADLEDEDRDTQNVAQVKEFWTRAMEELVSDIVCTHLFGLSAVLAYEEMGLIKGLDQLDMTEVENHYPPWRFRLRVMLGVFPAGWVDRALDQGGFSNPTKKAIEAKWGELTALAQATPDQEKIDNNPILAAAYDSVANLLPDAAKFVKQRMQEKALDIESLIPLTQSVLLDKLTHLFPPELGDLPCPEGQPVTIGNAVRAILTAGWIRRMLACPSLTSEKLRQDRKDANDLLEEDSFFTDLETLNRLVDKALEYVEVGVGWSQWQATLPKEN